MYFFNWCEILKQGIRFIAGISNMYMLYTMLNDIEIMCEDWNGLKYINTTCLLKIKNKSGDVAWNRFWLVFIPLG